VIPIARAQEILLPVTTGMMAVTLIGALLLNLVPWPQSVLQFRPDLCALVLAYWGMHQPRGMAFSAAFLLGLAMDIADASLFGQHALGYTVLLYAAIAIHRRALKFSLASQVLHVLPLLLAADGIALVVRLVAGTELPGWSFVAGSAIGAALWLPLSALLRLPRLPKPDPDRV